MGKAAAVKKIPKSLAQAADLYYTTRQDRLALQKQVDAIEEFEKQLKEHLINNIPKSDGNGVFGKLVQITVDTKPIPQVKDWDKFYEYVAKNRSRGSFALLNRAVNAGAVKEIWEAGKEVPGVSRFNAVTISVSKLK